MFKFVKKLFKKQPEDLTNLIQDCLDDIFTQTEITTNTPVVRNYSPSMEEIVNSSNLIREYEEDVKWLDVNINDINFLREFRDKIQWVTLMSKYDLDEKIIEEFKEDIGWSNISAYQDMSTEFIKKYKGEIDWKIYETCGFINRILKDM